MLHRRWLGGLLHVSLVLMGNFNHLYLTFLFSTKIPMPTVTRACYDSTQSGCRGGLSCFQWYVYICSRPPASRVNLMSTGRLMTPGAFNSKTSSYGSCVTTVLFGGANTWYNCWTTSHIRTISVSQPPKATTTGPLVGAITPGPSCYITRRPTLP